MCDSTFFKTHPHFSPVKNTLKLRTPCSSCASIDAMYVMHLRFYISIIVFCLCNLDLPPNFGLFNTFICFSLYTKIRPSNRLFYSRNLFLFRFNTRVPALGGVGRFESTDAFDRWSEGMAGMLRLAFGERTQNGTQEFKSSLSPSAQASLNGVHSLCEG